MASLTIKNLPDEVLDALRRRAAENQRSLNQEAIFCLRSELLRKRRTAADAHALLERIEAVRNDR